MGTMLIHIILGNEHKRIFAKQRTQTKGIQGSRYTFIEIEKDDYKDR